jgi:probable F420-dependent oxidoreductase
MGSDHDVVRARLGRVGVWSFAFDAIRARDARDAAAAIERVGFSALWVPEGGSSREIFAHLSLLLAATERITVCSGIANVTARHPEAMAGGGRTLADGFGERVVLGIGIGHQSTTGRRRQEWENPVGRMRSYLDVMDSSAMGPDPDVPVRRLMAALGPRMLEVAADRALGAHTYFVPVEHTARARKILGPEPVLAVEQTAILTTDAVAARAMGRTWAADYLDLPNYANNWRRLGYGDEEIAGSGSDRLIDAGIVWGDAAAVVGRVREHLDAGADHVCVQVISGRDEDVCLPQLSEVWEVLRTRRTPGAPGP